MGSSVPPRERQAALVDLEQAIGKERSEYIKTLTEGARSSRVIINTHSIDCLVYRH
jgi:hypothetical protein